jgi:hypothetical protein
MNRNTQNLAIGRLPRNDTFPPFHTNQSRASTESASSAEERLQWRSHPNVATPHPDLADQNPFEDPSLAVASPQSTRDGGEGLGEGVQEQIRREEAVEEEEEEDNANERIDTSSTEKSHDSGVRDPWTCAIVPSRDSTKRSMRSGQEQEEVEL